MVSSRQFWGSTSKMKNISFALLTRVCEFYSNEWGRFQKNYAAITRQVERFRTLQKEFVL
jgi:hypothetical protein